MELATLTVNGFVQRLSAMRFDNVFNPYADVCPVHDLPTAPKTRRLNLELVMQAALRSGARSLWIGRDLGYRGGRRTGLPLTDEAHLAWQAELLGTPPLKKATQGPLMKERTATIVWEMIKSVGEPVFLWNVFPFHPHDIDDPMSNRSHSRSERLACRPILTTLLDMLRPSRIVAIGRDAHFALQDLEIPSVAVRHPSYGGQSEFISGLSKIYGLPKIHNEGSAPLLLI